MLSRIVTALLLAVLVSATLATPPAIAKGECSSRAKEGAGGIVKLVVSCPAKDSTKRLSSNKRECFAGTWKLPCRSDQGSWYSPEQCYISPVLGKTPWSNPAWEGHRTGRLYYCRLSGLNTGTPLVIWLPTATAPPDPELLARRAVSQMQLRPIEIGIVPEDRPGRVGLVGMPVWLWVADPAPQTWGPISRSASAGGVTVRATAHVSRIRWSMGDGSVVGCSGKGTRYVKRFGDSMSPTCGYRYDRQGSYGVTAVSDWVVRWAGEGARGTFTIQLQSSTRVVVGELQVTTVDGRK